MLSSSDASQVVPRFRRALSSCERPRSTTLHGMIFLFLHGPPAVGKLTIAREVAEQTGFRLFHNHLTVDLVLSVYDFGTPGFIALREQIWLAVIRRSLADRVPGMIFTFNPENSVPQRADRDSFPSGSPPMRPRLNSASAPNPVVTIESWRTSRSTGNCALPACFYRR